MRKRLYCCSCQPQQIYLKDLKNHLKIPLNHKITSKNSSFNHKTYTKKKCENLKTINSSHKLISDNFYNLDLEILQKISQFNHKLKRIQYTIESNNKNFNTNPIKTSEFSLKLVFHSSTFLKEINEHLKNNTQKILSTLISFYENPQSSFKEFLKTHTSSIITISFSPKNNFLLSGGEDAMIRLWNPMSLEIKKSVSFHKSKINSIDIKNNFSVSGSSDKSIGLWKLPDLKLDTCFQGHNDEVLTVKICGNSHFVSGSKDKTLKIWNITKKTMIFEITSNSTLTSMIIPKNLKFLLIFNETGEIIKLEIESKEKVIKKIYDSSIYSSLALDKEVEFLVTGQIDGKIAVYDMKTVIINKIFQAHSNNITSLSLCKKNNTFASGSLDCTVKLWNRETFELISILPRFSASISCVYYVDSRLYISGASSKIFLFNTNLNSIVNVTKMKRFYINCFSFCEMWICCLLMGRNKFI